MTFDYIVNSQNSSCHVSCEDLYPSKILPKVLNLDLDVKAK